jgi:type VI protein secretion system component VasK
MNPQPMADPLAQLHDIHLATPPGAWPLALGWWLLLFIALACLIGVVYALRRHLRHPKRAALRELAQLHQRYQQHGDIGHVMATLSQLLRRAALTRYPRQRIAALHGPAWLDFLDHAGKTKAFSQGIGRVFADQPYHPLPAVDVVPLLSLCRQWLKRAL